jgi:hypothetical protein
MRLIPSNTFIFNLLIDYLVYFGHAGFQYWIQKELIRLKGKKILPVFKIVGNVWFPRVNSP